jgi:hypothetical protein
MGDVQAVISAIHMTGDDESAILAVHRVLESIRERARGSSPNGRRPD